MKTTIKLHPNKFQIDIFFMVIALSALEISFLSINSDIIAAAANYLRAMVFIILIVSVLYVMRKIPVHTELILYFMAVAILSYRSGFYNFLLLITIVLALWKKNIDEILSVFFVAQTICLAVFFYLYNFKLISNNMYVADDRLRNTLGFNNVNFAAFFFMSWLVIWLLWSGMKTVNIAVAGIVGLMVFKWTNSRTSLFFLILFLLFYSYFLWYFKNKISSRNLIMVTDILIIIFTALPFFSDFLLQFKWLDALLSGRLSIISDSIKLLNLEQFLIGTKAMPKGLYISESFVINLIFYFGFIFLIWTMLIILRGINNIIKSHNASIAAFIVALWIADYTESFLFRLDNMTFIIFWVFSFIYAYRNNSSRQTCVGIVNGEVEYD